jgi:hypothetical protein
LIRRETYSRGRALGLVLALLGTPVSLGESRCAEATALPSSDYRMVFDWSGQRRLASGSDNWPVTWAVDGRVYTIWGDGGGFTARHPYVSLGLASLVGNSAAGIRGTSLIGGHRPRIAPCFPLLRNTLRENRSYAGCKGKAHAKSYGMLALGSDLYAWTQPGSCRPEYGNATLHRNELGTNRWTSAGWKLTGLFSPTFVQKGRNHSGGDYIHLYAVRIAIRNPSAPCLSVMGKPVGEIVLARARKGANLLDQRVWQWWNGTGWGSGSVKAAVFRHSAGIGPKISATYLPTIGRFVLITEVGGSGKGTMAFYESPNPNGPWRRITQTRFPGTTFMATIMPQSLRAGNRMTVGFTGGQEHDALNLVDVQLLRR